jgi:hypothetical protein
VFPLINLPLAHKRSIPRFSLAWANFTRQHLDKSANPAPISHVLAWIARVLAKSRHGKQTERLAGKILACQRHEKTGDSRQAAFWN